MRALIEFRPTDPELHVSMASTRQVADLWLTETILDVDAVHPHPGPPLS